MDWLAPKSVAGRLSCSCRLLNICSPYRLSLCCLLLSAALFISGNVLIWTSLDTCRPYAPYLWYGVATVIAVGWALLAEVVIVVVVVGVFGGPVLTLAQKIGLATPPRVPFPAPPPALSRELVEKLPLVRYDSLTPDGGVMVSGSEALGGEKRLRAIPLWSGRRHSYARSNSAAVAREAVGCSICLIDFEQRSRTDTETDIKSNAGVPAELALGVPVLAAQHDAEQSDRLRLLPCGHVFHVSAFRLLDVLPLRC